jgi:BASS family bile acid:Na+ symporter
MKFLTATGRKFIFYPLFVLIIICLLFTIVLVSTGNIARAGLPFVFSFVFAALFVRENKRWRGSAFTFWVFAFLAAAMYFPWLFTNWVGFNTKHLVLPLIMLIMFGMGTKLSISDFIKEFKHPKGIVIGTVLGYTIMPLAGLLLTKFFSLDPAVAVGVILIGSCPGGVASNVMTYLANGNVALSVTITTFATLISPIATPLLMHLLAGELLDVSFSAMMFTILKIIIAPVVLGLIVNKLLRDKRKLLDKILPYFSMIAIIFFVTIVVAHYRDQLVIVGLILLLISVIHNSLGLTLGYWLSKLSGMNERDCRTISIEVGLKNGGLGMGLALDALKSPAASFAPIVFGKWMNIAGSAIANYWRERPAEM